MYICDGGTCMCVHLFSLCPVNYDCIVTNSINSLLIGSRCVPNSAHTNHCRANLAHASKCIKISDLG